MHIIPKSTLILAPLAMLSISASGQELDPTEPNIIVNGDAMPSVAEMAKGPEIKGIISARNEDKLKITSADGSNTVIAITSHCSNAAAP